MAGNPQWTLPPANQLELRSNYEAQIRQSYVDGEFEPVVWPYRTWGFFVVIAYLMLPPTNSTIMYYARYPVYIYFVYWCWKCSTETRSIHMHGNYAIGLISSWSIIWLASLMIFSNARAAARRIERREKRADNYVIYENGRATHPTIASAIAKGNDRELRERQPEQQGLSKGTIFSGNRYSYYWQPLPQTFLHRVYWVYDLTTSFRGAGWTHQTAGIPRPPQHVLATLPTPHKGTPCPASSYQSSNQILLYNLRTFLICALIIDWWKTFALQDPYFWGYAASAPAPWLPTFIQSSPVLTHSWRLLASVTGILAALNFVCSLNALIYLGVFGERLLGAYAEPWMFVSCFGSVNILLEEGLTGWWGRFWHQLFRIGFTGPTKAILKLLRWDAKSGKGKALGAVVAFGLSGLVHAAGSWTSWPKTATWKPIMFFALQGVGVGLEMVVGGWLNKSGFGRTSPKWVWRVWRGSWVLIFMCCTGDLLASDFGRAGIWLFEPLPVSIFRGLGFGLSEEGWWCWRGTMIWWHTADKWWKSGIAL